MIFNILGQPLMIVVEFAEHGNLHHYLRDHRKQNYDDMNKYSLDISSAERLRIACDVAEGMKHLATMRVRCKFFKQFCTNLNDTFCNMSGSKSHQKGARQFFFQAGFH